MRTTTSGFILLFMLVLSANAMAQKELPLEYQNINDTAEISRLVKKAKIYEHSNPDSLIYIIDIIDVLAKKTNSKIHLLESILLRGGFHRKMGEFQKALDFYFSGNELAKQIENEYYLNTSNLLISSIYLHLAYYPLAEKYMLSTLKYYEKNGNNAGMGGVYLNMTFIKLEQKDYQEAKKYGDLAYKDFSLSDYNIGTTMALGNLCEVNYYLKNYDLAIENGRKALKNSKLYNQTSINSFIYLTLGDVYSKLNKIDSAQYFYNQSINSSKIWSDSYMLSKCKQSIAMLYARQGIYTKALFFANESFLIADSNKFASIKASAAEMIAQYHSIRGNYKEAYEFKEIASHINDSLFNKEKYKVQNEIEAIYQSQKKEETIATLASEKEMEIIKNKQSQYYIGSLLVILIILTMSGVLLYRNSKINSLRKTVELEQRLLRVQMNPHFIFNAIACIQEYIVGRNPLEASSYLSDFAKLMRSILNNSSKEFISLDEELDTMENYMKLQKLRFQNKLEYEIIVDEQLDQEEVFIPPMLAQPFIENAINHGISKRKEGTGKIRIEFAQLQKNLILRISDNGYGLKEGNEKKEKKHRSMAIQITHSRINNFKKVYKKETDFQMRNLTDISGAVAGFEVYFKLPQKTLNI